ncbi:uncharacterized protein LOC8268399 [Ricinus communis]|jgi:hypothetical protein|uniref:uncharacterized protein LOC8268399 n=1 Tax=Ricinus communis TaxID=3988 RepID=UPI00201AAD01|nr:uncharacterized protein LOC8268399 [Ricinus communis]
MAVHLIQGLQSKFPKKYKALPLHYSNGFAFHGETYLVIKLPHSRLLRLVARSIVLSLIFFTCTMFSPFSPGTSLAVSEPESLGPRSNINLDVLPLLFRDLITNEGLIKTGDKAVFVTNGNGNDDRAIYSSERILNEDYDMEFISVSDLDQQQKVNDASFDFALTYSFHAAQEFIDRTLKVGGIAIVQLGDNPSFLFNKPMNYKIVYLRRFQSTFMAMKKTGYGNTNLSTQRKLLSYRTEARKAVLNNLEDVLLEPPRAASGKSRTYLKRTKYLPDLMGDSLESYPRRVFIDVGLPEREGGSGIGWFAKHYPTRNLDFEMYKIETVTEVSSGKEVPQVEEIGMSGWLSKNVKEEEYVVMKAEAEVVEEMIESRSIRLVDELFMDCKPRGHGGKGNGSRRAYWECLALYGRLRDEGIAVHQWWG